MAERLPYLLLAPGAVKGKKTAGKGALGWKQSNLLRVELK